MSMSLDIREYVEQQGTWRQENLSSSYLSPFFLKTPCGGGALSLCCDIAESLTLL